MLLKGVVHWPKMALMVERCAMDLGYRAAGLGLGSTPFDQAGLGLESILFDQVQQVAVPDSQSISCWVQVEEAERTSVVRRGLRRMEVDRCKDMGSRILLLVAAQDQAGCRLRADRRQD